MTLTKMSSFLVAVMLAVSLCGCATVKHWGRVLAIETHEGLDDYFGDGVKPSTNLVPVTVTPPADKPVTGALVCPLAYLGDETTVDGILSRGELPESDNRSPYKFQLLRPSGKSWSFANFVEAGLVRDGKVFAGAWRGQHYTPVYQSEHDQGVHMAGHPLADGVALGGERFIYFECREIVK